MVVCLLGRVTDRNVRIAVAGSILDVCKHNPDDALQLVPLLQTLLHDSCFVVVSLSVCALRTMCVQYYLDVFAVLVVLRFSKAPLTSAVARREMCRLYAVAADDSLNPEFEMDTIEVLNDLHQQCLPHSNPYPTARAAAFRSLSRFVDFAIQDRESLQEEPVLKWLGRLDILSSLWRRLGDETSGCARSALQNLWTRITVLEIVSG